MYIWPGERTVEDLVSVDAEESEEKSAMEAVARERMRAFDDFIFDPEL
jgi:hypothetical protein